jgi:hypothetical protein
MLLKRQEEATMITTGALTQQELHDLELVNFSFPAASAHSSVRFVSR